MHLFQRLLDLIFPPSPSELCVRTLTTEKLSHLRMIPHVHAVPSLFSYKNEDVRALIWQLKYKYDPRAITLASVALREYLNEFAESEIVLIPIPLSPKRERERGYNQVEVVCREAVRGLSHVSLAPHILTRVRHTPPQTSLSRYQRLKNMHGAFAIQKRDEVEGKNILLIDDVTTTGATFREAKEVLVAAGAKKVDCLALAH